MHELGIAQSIVDVVEAEARGAGARRVLSVTLALGDLSGVVEEHLRACFPFVIADTLLEEAELVIERVAGEGWCRRCEESFPLSGFLDPCPRCGAPTNDVRAGQDLVIKTLEIED